MLQPNPAHPCPKTPFETNPDGSMTKAQAEGAVRSLLTDLSRCQAKVILGVAAWPKGQTPDNEKE